MVFVEPVSKEGMIGLSHSTVWQVFRQGKLYEVPELTGEKLSGLSGKESPLYITHIWNTPVSVALIVDGVGHPVEEDHPVLKTRVLRIVNGKVTQTQTSYIPPSSLASRSITGAEMKMYYFCPVDVMCAYHDHVTRVAKYIVPAPFYSIKRILLTAMRRWWKKWWFGRLFSYRGSLR